MSYFLGKYETWNEIPANIRALSFNFFLQDHDHLIKKDYAEGTNLAMELFDDLYIKKKTLTQEECVKYGV